MGVILEIRGGALAGKVIAVAMGRSVSVGRGSGRADMAFPEDTFMSGVHFAVECSASGCRVQDRKSSNGTFLNGARVQDAMLANGDEIKAGQTIFAVKMVSDEKLAGLAPSSSGAAAPLVPAASVSSGEGRISAEAPSAKLREVAAPAPRRTTAPDVESDLPSQTSPPSAIAPPPPKPPRVSVAAQSLTTPPPAARAGAAPADERRASASARSPEQGAANAHEFAAEIMGWLFPRVPPRWQVQQGLGFQSDEGNFPSSVAATQESLGGMTLAQFVEFQLNMLKNYLREASIEPVVPPRVAGAEETLAVDVRHKTKDGKELVYRRIYARSGSVVGVLTVTSLASEVGCVLESFAVALNGIGFRSAR
jgi:pSer/pThr/pTyr-binding forkhead associated (FHA) protein